MKNLEVAREFLTAIREMRPTNRAAREVHRILSNGDLSLDAVVFALLADERAWNPSQDLAYKGTRIPPAHWRQLRRTIRNFLSHGDARKRRLGPGLDFIVTDPQYGATAKPAQPGTFPRMWEIMGFCLPPKMHDRIWTPAIEDQKRKYCEARRTYRTRGARAFLFFAFSFRTLMMLPDCYRLMGLSKLQAFFNLIVPEPVKRWWFNR